MAGEGKKQETEIIADMDENLIVTNRPALRILAVDDTPANLELLIAVLTYAGHGVITASSGEEALALYQANRPDVVLMDVMMPGIGGIEATRRMRALEEDRWIPIIFISALSHRDDVIRGLEAGGDDYLAKPVDVVLLLAKINAMQRVAVLEDRLRRSNEQLKAYRDRSEHELGLAHELMEQMVSGSSVMFPGMEMWMQPAANLGGDLIIAQQFGNEKNYLMLADAMGHGLSATLPLVPLVQVFSDMARSGQSVSAMVREMNARLTGLLPVGNFVTVTLVSVDRAKRELKVWNGGNPPLLLSEADGKIIRKFQSRHIAIGICRDIDFDAGTELFQCGKPCRLTLFSDGLLDAVNAAGEPFGEERVYAALQQEDAHGALKKAVLDHLQGMGAHDDISLATVRLT